MCDFTRRCKVGLRRGTHHISMGSYSERGIFLHVNDQTFVIHKGPQNRQFLHDGSLNGVDLLNHLGLSSFEEIVDLCPQVPLAFGSDAPEMVRALLHDGVSSEV